jgi:DNA-binding NtrC family response regulator
MSSVLIVDDDARIRDVLARWLTAAGYETQQAPDAESALELLAEGRTDVVLCDVAMPGRGGLWLVERAREQNPAVAVVLATGIEDVHPSISLGGNVVDYLVKPFERATVLTAVGLARAWHEAAARVSASAPGGDPLSLWLRGGRSQPPEVK